MFLGSWTASSVVGAEKRKSEHQLFIIFRKSVDIVIYVGIVGRIVNQRVVLGYA